MKFRLLALLVAVGIAAPVSFAESAPPDGKPKSWDWTGFYGLARARALRGTGLEPVNEDLDKTIMAHRRLQGGWSLPQSSIRRPLPVAAFEGHDRDRVPRDQHRGRASYLPES
jgi:hypothetical protein